MKLTFKLPHEGEDREYGVEGPGVIIAFERCFEEGRDASWPRVHAEPDVYVMTFTVPADTQRNRRLGFLGAT